MRLQSNNYVPKSQSIETQSVELRSLLLGLERIMLRNESR